MEIFSLPTHAEQEAMMPPVGLRETWYSEVPELMERRQGICPSDRRKTHFGCRRAGPLRALTIVPPPSRLGRVGAKYGVAALLAAALFSAPPPAWATARTSGSDPVANT